MAKKLFYGGVTFPVPSVSPAPRLAGRATAAMLTKQARVSMPKQIADQTIAMFRRVESMRCKGEDQWRAWADAIHDAIWMVAPIFVDPHFSTLRHYSNDPKILGWEKRCGVSVIAGATIAIWPLEDQRTKQEQALHPGGGHYLVPPGPLHPRIMFDYVHGYFTIDDPWEWRRAIAYKYGERLNQDQLAEYFPESGMKKARR